MSTIPKSGKTREIFAPMKLQQVPEKGGPSMRISHIGIQNVLPVMVALNIRLMKENWNYD